MGDKALWKKEARMMQLWTTEPEPEQIADHIPPLVPPLLGASARGPKAASARAPISGRRWEGN